MTSNLKLITADCRKLPVKSKSVNLVIVHPPYFNMDPFRYGGNPKSQINFKLNRKIYVKNMVTAVKELERVLVDDGSIWVNIGAAHGADIDVVAAILKNTGLKIADNLVHYHPTTTEPTPQLKSESVSVWYRLVKTPDAYSNPYEIRKYSSGIWEFPFNNMGSTVDQEMSKRHHMLDVVNQELPRRLIQMYSRVGDTVLDSFGGTAIVAVTAVELDRIGISIDISPAQKIVAEERARLTL